MATHKRGICSRHLWPPQQGQTLLYAILGFQIGQSEEPEVGGIWQEHGGKPLYNSITIW